MSVHHCHWPGCRIPVAPRLWGCKKHWMMLPKHLRDLIWATYRPGQEITKDPSREYMNAAKLVQDWITKNGHAAEQTCAACGLGLKYTRLFGFVCPRGCR